MMRANDSEECLENFFHALHTIPVTKGFSDFQGQDIFLYGAGNLGKKLYDCLLQNGIQPIGFIDRDTGKRNLPVPVYAADDMVLEPYHQSAVVILAGLFGRTQDHAIRHMLKEYGFVHIYALHEINWQVLESRAFLAHMFIGSYNPVHLIRDEEKIRDAYAFFSSEEERHFLLTCLTAYHAHDVTIFPVPLPLEEQYLAADIPNEQADYRRFIDCGAYDGDALRSLMHHGKQIDAYAAFEPQEDLCARIHADIQKHSSIRIAHILPLGVSDRYEKLHFTAVTDGRSAAKADAAGTDVLPCVPIDAVLHGFTPTFIKMDIEGMEPKALQGAAETIRTHRPQLAICVYHDISHLFEIPKQIKELYAGYRLYIRNYQYMGLETVVYAFP